MAYPKFKELGMDEKRNATLRPRVTVLLYGSLWTVVQKYRLIMVAFTCFVLQNKDKRILSSVPFYCSSQSKLLTFIFDVRAHTKSAVPRVGFLTH